MLSFIPILLHQKSMTEAYSFIIDHANMYLHKIGLLQTVLCIVLF